MSIFNDNIVKTDNINNLESNLIILQENISNIINNLKSSNTNSDFKDGTSISDLTLLSDDNSLIRRIANKVGNTGLAFIQDSYQQGSSPLPLVPRKNICTCEGKWESYTNNISGSDNSILFNDEFDGMCENKNTSVSSIYNIKVGTNWDIDDSSINTSLLDSDKDIQTINIKNNTNNTGWNNSVDVETTITFNFCQILENARIYNMGFINSDYDDTMFENSIPYYTSDSYISGHYAGWFDVLRADLGTSSSELEKTALIPEYYLSISYPTTSTVKLYKYTTNSLTGLISWVLDSSDHTINRVINPDAYDSSNQISVRDILIDYNKDNNYNSLYFPNFAQQEFIDNNNYYNNNDYESAIAGLPIYNKNTYSRQKTYKLVITSTVDREYPENIILKIHKTIKHSRLQGIYINNKKTMLSYHPLEFNLVSINSNIINN